MCLKAKLSDQKKLMKRSINFEVSQADDVRSKRMLKAIHRCLHQICIADKVKQRKEKLGESLIRFILDDNFFNKMYRLGACGREDEEIRENNLPSIIVRRINI